MKNDINCFLSEVVGWKLIEGLIWAEGRTWPEGLIWAEGRTWPEILIRTEGITWTEQNVLRKCFGRNWVSDNAEIKNSAIRRTLKRRTTW